MSLFGKYIVKTKLQILAVQIVLHFHQSQVLKEQACHFS